MHGRSLEREAKERAPMKTWYKHAASNRLRSDTSSVCRCAFFILCAIGFVSWAVHASASYRPGLWSTGHLDISVGPGTGDTRLPVLGEDGEPVVVTASLTKEPGRAPPRDLLLTLTIPKHPGQIFFVVQSMAKGTPSLIFFTGWYETARKGKPARYTADLGRARAEDVKHLWLWIASAQGLLEGGRPESAQEAIDETDLHCKVAGDSLAVEPGTERARSWLEDNGFWLWVWDAGHRQRIFGPYEAPYKGAREWLQLAREAGLSPGPECDAIAAREAR
jgi:hypothetical protein